MWRAMPEHWYSWNFTVQDAIGMTVAELKLSSWRDRGTIIVGGAEHPVSRKGKLKGTFVLKRAGSILAQAERPSIFRSSYRITFEGKQYTLKPKSVWRQTRILLDGERRVGSVAPQSFFSRRVRIDLPDDLPILLKLFMVWLTLMQWKHESSAAAASAGAG